LITLRLQGVHCLPHPIDGGTEVSSRLCAWERRQCRGLRGWPQFTPGSGHQGK
jgi:hypothetical protein